MDTGAANESNASGIRSDRSEPADNGESSFKGLSEELIMSYMKLKLKKEIEEIAKQNRIIGRMQVIGWIGNLAIGWFIFDLIYQYLH